MQVIALVTEDSFLDQFNLTIDSKDILTYMKKLHTPWQVDSVTRDAHFDDFYGVFFAMIIGTSGFCYNFNMIESQNLFNLNL
jgi:hypothetical protein